MCTRAGKAEQLHRQEFGQDNKEDSSVQDLPGQPSDVAWMHQATLCSPADK